MKQIILTVLYTGSLILMTACGESGNDAEAKADAKAGSANKEQPASSTGKLYDREITKKPCDLLTSEAVAEVAGVESSAVEHRRMASLCLFTWEGGKASIGLLRTEKTVKTARRRFEMSYANQSGEEVAEAAAQINAQIEKQNDADKTDVDTEHAKVVTNTLSDTFSGGFQFEDIPGVGDMARFDITRTETSFGGQTLVSYANTLNVLTGNLKFTVSFSRDGDPKLYKDEGVALAEAALRSLSN